MDPFLGEVRIMPYRKRAPIDWQLCDGSLLNIAQYPQLYSLIGIAFGGDNVTTFGIPRLQGRVVVGTGQQPNGTNFALGATGGTETVTLTAAQVPNHTHTFQASTSADAQTSPKDALFGTVVGDKQYAPTAQKLAALSGAAISNSGGDMTHSNVMPSIALYYCICTNGIYPNRP